MARGRTTSGRAGARRDRGAGAADASLRVYGANAVLELLASGQPISRLSIGRGPRESELREAAARRGIVVETVDGGGLERLAGSPHHQGVVAEAPPFRYVDIERLLAPDCGSVLILDGIQDPRNLGAVLRTARAAGVGGVVLPQDRSVGVTGVVVASAAGLVFGLRIARVPNLVRAMEGLREAGFWLLGLVPRDGTPLDRLDLPSRPGLVIGGEGGGLRPLVRRTCDFAVSIPMAAGVESLNVSVAAGIALYEVLLRGGTRG